MSKRFVCTTCLAILSIPSFSALSATEGFFGVQQDMIQQVSEAQQDLREGQPMTAIARANLVLIDHPLKVYVAYDDVDGRKQRDCERAISAAIELWNQGLDGETQFERTDDAGSADIHMTFRQDVSDNGVAVGGLVTWRRAINYSYGTPTDSTTAEVQVRVHKPHGGGMSFEHMRHETSHELGHVLGLEDSPRRGDIMSPLDLRRPVGKISDFELDALKKLRRAAHEVKDQALLAYAGI